MKDNCVALFGAFKRLWFRLNNVAFFVFFMLPWPDWPAGTPLGHNELMTLSEPFHPQPPCVQPLTLG